jgi:hypothetical protein
VVSDGPLMARMRTVKPEFWESEEIGALSRDARLLYIATWNMADDEGRLRWTPAYIQANAFIYDRDLDVGAVMGELVHAELVVPYEMGMQKLAYIPSFGKHQKPNRPQPSKLPAPFSESDSAPFTPVVVEEGRVEEGCSNSSSPDDEFEDFWARWPSGRRVKKPDALRAHRRALLAASPNVILEGLERWTTHWAEAETEPRFIPHPASWLNARQWNDPTPGIPKAQGRASRNLAAIDSVVGAISGSQSPRALGR